MATEELTFVIGLNWLVLETRPPSTGPVVGLGNSYFFEMIGTVDGLWLPVSGGLKVVNYGLSFVMS